MKRIITFVAMTCVLATSVFALTAGDIAMFGMNADDTERVGFVALVNIPANTSITFTDCGWSNSTAQFRIGEHGWIWSHNAVVSAGTHVVMAFVSSAWTIETGPGSISTTDCAGFGGNSGLNASGDSILAYEGAGWSARPTSSSSTAWLYGINIEAWTTNGPPDSQTSDCPTALQGGYEVHFTDTATEWDNGYFASGQVAQTSVSLTGTKQQILDILGQGTTLYYFNNNPINPWPSYSFTVVPEPGLIGMAAVGLVAFLRRK